MPIRRPTPELIKARKWEIKRRYERKAKVGKRTKSMAAIRLSELTRWLDDAYGAGVELEPGRDALMIAELFAHHLACLANPQQRISEWLGYYAPSIPPQERQRLIANATAKPIHWSADKLAWKIRLTDVKRTELKIKTIGAIDCNKQQRELRRKAKRAERDRQRKIAKGSPSI